jgi:hypothetical protein
VQVRTASIDAQKEAAIAQAAALGNALSTADINIVGGTDMFVDRILGATAMGKAVGGFADSSEATKAIAKPYLNGERDLIETLAGAVGGSQGLANLSLARFLGVLADRVGGDEGALLSELVTSLKDRGLDTISLNQLTK